MTHPLLLVAAHDAGGAEIISSWLRRIYYPYPGLEGRVWLCVTGPAVKIFERKLGTLPRYVGDPWQAKLVLCGTSGATYLEKDVVDMAMSRGMRTVVWLDHWKNYEQRFRRAPSEIWVTDRHAAHLAGRLQWAVLQSGLIGRTVQQPKIVIAGNPYLEEVVAEVRQLRSPVPSGRAHVLAVYGPASEGQDIFRMPKRLGPPASLAVRHRPHPADAPCSRSLAEDIAWADVVVGFDSMAMVIAHRAGRRVVSVAKDSAELTLPVPVERSRD